MKSELIITFTFPQGLLLEYTPFIVGLNTQPEDQSLKDTIIQIHSHKTIIVFK